MLIVLKVDDANEPVVAWAIKLRKSTDHLRRAHSLKPG
jgi:hypothetical protein